MDALERFDARLAEAAKKLQALGKWEAVVQRGGSSEHGLSLALSQFDAEVRACMTPTDMQSLYACAAEPGQGWSSLHHLQHLHELTPHSRPVDKRGMPCRRHWVVRPLSVLL